MEINQESVCCVEINQVVCVTKTKTWWLFDLPVPVKPPQTIAAFCAAPWVRHGRRAVIGTVSKQGRLELDGDCESKEFWRCMLLSLNLHHPNSILWATERVLLAYDMNVWCCVGAVEERVNQSSSLLGNDVHEKIRQNWYNYPKSKYELIVHT